MIYILCKEFTSLKREYYVDIENCPREELDKAIEKFYVEVCILILSC